MLSRLARSFASVVLLGLMTVPAAQAQWTTNTSQNTLASLAPFSSRPALLRGDGGGTFVLWEDAATGVKLQFIDAAGFRQPTDRIVDALGEQAVMATDGSGGVFVAWQTQPGKIMIHRFDSALDPHPQWWSFAIPVASTSGDQSQPSIVSDEAGGAIVAWTDDSQEPQGDLRARRFTGSGVGQWGGSGKVLCNVAGKQIASKLAIDGAGGAFAVWEDGRNDAGDIFAQHVDAGGVTQWPTVNSTQGTQVFTGSDRQRNPLVVSDDSGGFIAAWHDGQPAPAELHAQRVYGSGLPAWGSDVFVGKLSNFLNEEISYAIDRDHSGGMVLAWELGDDIQAQRLSPSGVKLWNTGGGVAVTAGGHANFRRITPAIAAFSDGSAVVSWGTHAHDQPIDRNIYSLHIAPWGQVIGLAGGDVVTDAAGGQGVPAVIADGFCRSKHAWADQRPGGADGVYAHRLTRRYYRCVPRVNETLITVQAVSHDPLPEMQVEVVVGTTGGLTELSNAEFEVAYDPELVALVEVNLEAGALEGSTVIVDSETPGLVRLTSSGAAPLAEGLRLFELGFEPVVEAGTAILNLTAARLDGESVVVEAGRLEFAP